MEFARLLQRRLRAAVQPRGLFTRRSDPRKGGDGPRLAAVRFRAFHLPRQFRGVCRANLLHYQGVRVGNRKRASRSKSCSGRVAITSTSKTPPSPSVLRSVCAGSDSRHRPRPCVVRPRRAVRGSLARVGDLRRRQAGGHRHRVARRRRVLVGTRQLLRSRDARRHAADRRIASQPSQPAAVESAVDPRREAVRGPARQPRAASQGHHPRHRDAQRGGQYGARGKPVDDGAVSLNLLGVLVVAPSVLSPSSRR